MLGGGGGGRIQMNKIANELLCGEGSCYFAKYAKTNEALLREVEPIRDLPEADEEEGEISERKAGTLLCSLEV